MKVYSWRTYEKTDSVKLNCPVRHPSRDIAETQFSYVRKTSRYPISKCSLFLCHAPLNFASFDLKMYHRRIFTHTYRYRERQRESEPFFMFSFPGISISHMSFKYNEGLDSYSWVVMVYDQHRVKQSRPSSSICTLFTVTCAVIFSSGRAKSTALTARWLGQLVCIQSVRDETNSHK